MYWTMAPMITQQDDEQGQVDERVRHLARHDLLGPVRVGEDEVQRRPDDEDRHAEGDQPPAGAPHPAADAEQRSTRVGDDRLLGLEELDELDRPAEPDRAPRTAGPSPAADRATRSPAGG